VLWFDRGDSAPRLRFPNSYLDEDTSSSIIPKWKGGGHGRIFGGRKMGYIEGDGYDRRDKNYWVRWSHCVSLLVASSLLFLDFGVLLQAQRHVYIPWTRKNGGSSWRTAGGNKCTHFTFTGCQMDSFGHLIGVTRLRSGSPEKRPETPYQLLSHFPIFICPQLLLSTSLTPMAPLAQGSSSLPCPTYSWRIPPGIVPQPLFNKWL